MKTKAEVMKSFKYRLLKLVWWTSYKVYKWAGNRMVWMQNKGVN